MRSICTCLAFCLLTFASYSQELGKLSATFNDEPLKEVINELSGSYGLLFSYTEEIVENKRVSTSFSNVGLEEALDAIFLDQGIQYEVEQNRYVILSRATSKVEPELIPFREKLKLISPNPVSF